LNGYVYISCHLSGNLSILKINLIQYYSEFNAVVNINALDLVPWVMLTALNKGYY